MQGSAVELVGTFTASEALFLRTQFDLCRIKLMGRSRFDDRVVLVRWSPDTFDPAEPVTDRGRRPNVAYYVLDSQADERLVPIVTPEALDALYPNHFESDLIPAGRTRLGCLGASIWALGMISIWLVFTSV